MINGIYLSTMGAMVQSTRHSTIANNLANVNTVGFKPDWARFRHIPSESEWNPQLRFSPDEVLRHTGGGAWMERTATDLRQGAPRVTGNPYDFFLHDDPAGGEVSFFMVRPAGAEAGTVHYTRAGQYVLSEDGVLRNPQGDTLLGPGGAPIQLSVSPDAQVNVNADGTIYATTAEGNEEVGQIGIVATADRGGMRKVGDSRFVPEAGVEFRARQDGLEQGTLEGSASNPIREMVDMIEAQRAYDLNMRFLSIQDETLGSTVRRITAVG